MDFLLQQSVPVKSLILYGGVSLVNGLLSRIVMTKFFFDYPIVLVIFHMALTLSLIELGRLIKLFKVQPYTFYRGKDVFVPSLLYSLSQYILLNSLDGITLPLFPFIQKFFVLLVIPCYVLLLHRQRPSVQTLIVLFCVCVGSALSSVYELNFDPWALAYSLLALLMLTISLVLMERLHNQNNSALELIYMNSFNCLCLFLLADIVQDEIRDAYMYMQTSTSPVFYVCLLSLIVVGALCHAVLIHCITTANTLNTAIVHNFTAAIQVLVAYALSIEVFYDTEPDWNNIFGVILTMAATAFYFISERDRELKPQGHLEIQGTKYHRILAQ
ncbi:hypothetical protein niasHT_003883 [Heterodera trifolii]|uniref:Sugar phosphate transporter domain-containing protein n=1 Tax=Heterodera trifolii TaxID=157864 RepID=A0ABD2LV39_9BILA